MRVFPLILVSLELTSAICNIFSINVQGSLFLTGVFNFKCSFQRYQVKHLIHKCKILLVSTELSVMLVSVSFWYQASSWWIDEMIPQNTCLNVWVLSSWHFSVLLVGYSFFSPQKSLDGAFKMGFVSSHFCVCVICFFVFNFVCVPDCAFSLPVSVRQIFLKNILSNTSISLIIPKWFLLFSSFYSGLLILLIQDC